MNRPAPGPAAGDDILAVSSAPGVSARALLRMAGPRVSQLLAALGIDPLPPPRRLTSVRLRWRHAPADFPPIEVELPALLVRFIAPASYTGSALAELQLPGNPLLLEQLLHTLQQAGARLAEPGEFTFRAYLAGKLDLTQAEGVAAAIAAASDAQLAAARRLLDGELGALSRRTVDDLGAALALVEAGIDFSDQEDVTAIGSEALRNRLTPIREMLAHLLTHSRPWGELRGDPRVVLVGPPSAGKSTLLNALLGRQRAVTSAVPGTTRDVIEEPVAWLDRTGIRRGLVLCDMAGLDDPRTALDQQVQAAAQRAIRQADLLLFLHDPTQASPAPAVTPDNLPRLAVHSKSDIHPAPPGALAVSAITGEGLDELKQAILDALAQPGESASGALLALQPRHARTLEQARQELDQANALLAQQADPQRLESAELIAQLLRSALDSLATLGGQLSPDDVIGLVFSRFCVGK